MPVNIFADTQDEYEDALTLGPNQQLKQISFAVSAPNSAIFQLAKLGKDGAPYWDTNEMVAQPGVGSFSDFYGIRFRSFSPGMPTAVIIQGYFEDDGEAVAYTPGLSSFTPTSPGGSTTIIVNATPTPPTITPIWVPNPGPGVSNPTLYTVPPNTLGIIKLVTYVIDWDIGGGLGDRAIFYEMVDPNGGGPGIPAIFAYGQPGNTIYLEGSSPDIWLETDIGTMGNYFRTINTSIADQPIFNDLDFESGSAPFGDVQWPEGFFLRLTVPHMAATDELSAMRVLVSEVPAS